MQPLQDNRNLLLIGGGLTGIVIICTCVSLLALVLISDHGAATDANAFRKRDVYSGEYLCAAADDNANLAAEQYKYSRYHLHRPHGLAAVYRRRG